MGRVGAARGSACATFMTRHEMEKVWAEHLAAEFTAKDVHAALATMVEDASVDHVPVHTGGSGKQELLPFYRDSFIPSWPADLTMQPTNRVVGDDQLVDELHIAFTHAQRMDWFLPGVDATNRRVDIDIVVVVQFRDGKIARERIYWDQATVLRQLELM